jgi:hypothetical protein
MLGSKEENRESLLKRISDCWEKLSQTCPTRQLGLEVLKLLSDRPFLIQHPQRILDGWEKSEWAQYPPTLSDVMVDFLGATNPGDVILHDVLSRAREVPVEGETDEVCSLCNTTSQTFDT